MVERAQAEAAAMQMMTATALPQATASVNAMARTTAQLLDGLQLVLADLRPPALARFGLAVALQSLAAQPRRRADGGTLQVHLLLPDSWPHSPADQDVHLYRIVQEALTNAQRHSGAKQVQVQLQLAADTLRLCVEDDGQGLLPTAVPPPGQGLLGMEERVRALGGRHDWSRSPLGGLRLQVCLPWHMSESAHAAFTTEGRP